MRVDTLPRGLSISFQNSSATSISNEVIFQGCFAQQTRCTKVLDSSQLPGTPAAAKPLLLLVSRITASPTEYVGSTSLLRSTRVKLMGPFSRLPKVLLGLSPPDALVSSPFLHGLCTTCTMLCCSRSQLCWDQVEAHEECMC